MKASAAEREWVTSEKSDEVAKGSFSTKGKRFPNTTDFHTTFHRPLLLESVTIKASILKIGKNIVSVEGKIFNGKNMLVASCLHTGFLFDTQGMKK